MDDLISKSELLTALIHCKGLGRKSFESLIEFLENYPVDVNMEKIKEQIYEKGICSGYEEQGFIRIKDLMKILDEGGIGR